MTELFDPRSGPIVVRAEVSGPLGTNLVQLLLDTGATRTIIRPDALLSIGLSPDSSTRTAELVTGNGRVRAPCLVLTRLTSVGRTRIGLSSIAHSIEAPEGVAGLLGLDFLRGGRFLIDFDAGRIGYLE